MHISLLLFTLCVCYTACLYGCLYKMFQILVYVKMSVWVFVNACMCLKYSLTRGFQNDPQKGNKLHL